MRWGRALTAAAAIVAMGVGLSVESLSQTKEQAALERMRREISSLRQRLESTRREARNAEQELAAIDLELRLHATELEMASSILAGIERKKAAAERRIAELVPLIERQRKQLATRLAALYRMGETSYVRLFLSFDAKENPFEAASLLRYLIHRDARAVEAFRESRLQLAVERSALQTEEERSLKAIRIVADRKRAVESSRRKKESVLAQLRSESYQSEKELQELEEKAARLQRLLALLYERKPAERRGDSISDYRGVLPWPIQGKVVETFGTKRNPRFATVTTSNGIRIEAEPGTEVAAIFAGTVLYAEWFKGYGNLVIVDHGDRVFSLYGNLRPTNLVVGSRVEAGQVVGSVAASESAEAGSLYFEIRQNNEPANPVTWLR